MTSWRKKVWMMRPECEYNVREAQRMAQIASITQNVNKLVTHFEAAMGMDPIRAVIPPMNTAEPVSAMATCMRPLSKHAAVEPGSGP